MPILIGPQLAAALPEGSTELLGDYLLEGLSHQYALHAPADWTELVPAEQLWAGVSSHTSQLDVPRWAESSEPGSSLAYAANPQRRV